MLARLSMLRTGRRRGVFAAGATGRGRLNPERPGPDDLGSAGDDRGLEELNPPAGTDDLGPHLERPDGRRPEQLVGHPSEGEAVGGGQLFERAH